MKISYIGHAYGIGIEIETCHRLKSMAMKSVVPMALESSRKRRELVNAAEEIEIFSKESFQINNINPIFGRALQWHRHDRSYSTGIYSGATKLFLMLLFLLKENY